MDHRIININDQYLEFIKNIKKRLDDNKNFMDVLDEIELFWMKNKPFICEYLKYQKCSYIGGAMYIHFNEHEYRLPLCVDENLIMDEPICKIINMFRLNELIDENRMKEVLLHIVDNIIENEKTINKFGIVIVPMRLYYSNFSDDIKDISNSFTYQLLSEFSNYKIQNEKDLITFSKTIKNIEELNSIIKPDYIFTYQEDIDKNITEKMINYCKSCGRIIDSTNPKDIIEVLYEFLYSKFCQAIDLIYLSDILNLDLFVFREDVVYYLNIIKANLESKDKKTCNMLERTIISLFVHKELLQIDYKITEKTISDKKLLRIWNNVIERKKEFFSEDKIDFKKLKDIIVSEIK
jgi:hypothetical protein